MSKQDWNSVVKKFVYGIEKSAVLEEGLKMSEYFYIVTSAKEALDFYKSSDSSEKLFKAG